jgi:hypothetical protein
MFEVLYRLLTALAKMLDDRSSGPTATVTFRLLGIEGTVKSPFHRETVDERLAKIEIARHSLQDALGAVESLRTTAEQNKRDLEDLSLAIAKAESEKRGINEQLAALKQIAQFDGGAVRSALGLPTTVDIWKGYIVAFLFGIAASIVAAAVWELLIKPLAGWK